MSDALTLIGKGIMPFMGGMRKFMPYLYSTAQKHVTTPWSEVQFNDMTCGSASGACLFRFHGMTVHANDLSLRSTISAGAVLGGVKIKPMTVERLVAEACDPNVPDEAFLPEGYAAGATLPHVDGFLHPGAARIFDALYYAGATSRIPIAEGNVLRYVALRWVLLNKTYMYFVKLPTEELSEMPLHGDQWTKLAKILADPMGALAPVIRDVNHLIDAMEPRRKPYPRVTRGDCRESIKTAEFRDMSITNLNPPTAGNSVFMQSNRLLDTLLFNAPQEMNDDDMPGDLWRSIILDTGKRVPKGHFLFSFCGDGALTWEEGMETWRQLGEVVDEWSFPWHGDEAKRAGLVFIRRT